MGSIPLAANNLKIPEPPPNVLDNLARLAQIKNAQQQGQMGQIELQNAQQDQKDRQTISKLFQQNSGDLEKTIQGAAAAGVQPKTLAGLQSQSIDMKTKIATLNKDQLGNFAATHDNAAGIIQPVLDAKTPEQKDAAYQQGLAAIQANPTMYGITNPQQMPPPQRPPDDILKTQLALHMGQKEQAAQAMKEREVSAAEQTAQGRADQGTAALQKTAPLPSPQISFMNKQLQNRFQVLNPGQPLPPEYTVPQGANRQQYEDIDSSLQKLEQASTARQNRLQTQNTQNGARSDARADKSYQFNSGQLEKVAAPVDQAVTRIGRLQESLAQNNPQADSLIAPELLSVMAGGSGSGLRMNEAEISRVLGGRTEWETLQANLNKWSTDPTHAQIPPAQRQQITSLVNAVDAKLKLKQQALDDARQGLINSNDPNEHRQILATARGKMTQIDAGQQSALGQISVKAPDGSVHTFPDQAAADKFKALAHIQ